MSERERVWVVDRVEGAVAVLVADEDEATVEVLRSELPVGTGEGTVLRVPYEGDRPLWGSAVRDEELRRARLREAEEVLEELKGRDPGGDVVL
jgi:Protein of unknown function (DUF3006)